MKLHHYAALYAVAGLAVVGWTAYLGSQGKPHYASGSNGVVGLGAAFLLWPYAAYKNLAG